MSVRRRKTGWQVRVRPFPEQTVLTRVAADRIEGQLKERKALGDLWVEKPTTLGAELDLQWARKQLGGRRGMLRPSSLRFVSQTLGPWEPLREILIPNLRRALVEDHIMARATVAPRAARNELAALKSTLRQAEARGQRVDQGIYTIALGRNQARTGKALTVTELQTIALHMPAHVRRIVLVCGLVGLRWTEATRLEDTMLNLAAGTLTVPERLNKSRRDKTIPLANVEVQLLREQLLERPAATRLVFPTLAGTAYTESGFRSIWHTALVKAGFTVGQVRFHDLRHTATSLMCAQGMRPEHVAARRGDSDGGALVLKTYRHLFPNEVADAVKVMDGLLVRPVELREVVDAAQ